MASATSYPCISKRCCSAQALLAALLCNFVLAQAPAKAQDEDVSARTIEADYKNSSFFVKGVSCSDNAIILETAPEIAYTMTQPSGQNCNVQIVHKITYKLVGKTFHILNRPQFFPSVATFVVEKKDKK